MTVDSVLDFSRGYFFHFSFFRFGRRKRKQCAGFFEGISPGPFIGPHYVKFLNWFVGFKGLKKTAEPFKGLKKKIEIDHYGKTLKGSKEKKHLNGTKIFKNT